MRRQSLGALLYPLIAFVVGLLIGQTTLLVINLQDPPFQADPVERNNNCAAQLPVNSTSAPNSARELLAYPKLLCWILTGPGNHNRTPHVRATWGKRCDRLLIFSSQADSNLGILKLENVTEGRDFLWTKTRAAFQSIYKEHFREADWFLKADDDTFVVVENLRRFLKPKNASEPVYFGCRFKAAMFRYGNPDGYMTGGAGYVLSKEALRRLVQDAFPNERKCHPGRKDAGEDVHLARCLHNVGVRPGDSRDSAGLFTFFPLHPRLLTAPEGAAIIDHSYYWKRNWFNISRKQGMNAMSDRPISFHYVSPQDMYVLEYLLYVAKCPGSEQ